MVQHDTIARQLSQLGIQFRFFGKPEIRELTQILNAEEIIYHCTFGFYQGGSALLVATNTRLLLIDKKPFFVSLEDIRYEMINEVDFAGRFLDASVRIHTGSKELRFRSFSDMRLRELCSFIQDQITRARQLEHMLDVLKPAGSVWRPYTLIPRKRLSKYSAPTQ